MVLQNRVAIMQPYFLPYIGYWQLMNNVDVFVVYDNIKYTKNSWINRNRFLLNGRPETFSLPLKKDPDHFDVCQRQLANTFEAEKQKLARRVEMAYKKAPHFEEGMSLLNAILACDDNNLFDFIYYSIVSMHSALGIKSKLVISSSLDIPRELKGQERVIATCKALKATKYVNPIGGTELYSNKDFADEGIRLFFQKVRHCEYNQFDHGFVPYLSILDIFMFKGNKGVRRHLSEMDLIEEV